MTASLSRRRFVNATAGTLLGTAAYAGMALRPALGASAAGSKANRNTRPAAQRRDVLVYKDRFAYCSHASIAKLANGEWIVAFNESQLSDPYRHPPGDPHFHNLLTRSDDQGKSWSAPQAAPGWDWYGVECPGLAQLADGTVILNQWQFLWYPLDVGRKLHNQGREIWVAVNKQGFRVADENTDWDGLPLPWCRANGGCYVPLSSDGARTWDRTVKIDT